MRTLEVLRKRAGTQGNGGGQQCPLSMTRPGVQTFRGKGRSLLGPPPAPRTVAQQSPLRTCESEDGWA